MCDNIHGIFPTKLTAQSFDDMRAEFGMSSKLEFVVPEPSELPWNCSKGYICLYESFFTYCLMWFPLPYVFVKYCVDRDIAFTQIGTTGVYNMVGLMTLGAERGIEVTFEAFEEMSSINKGSQSGRFSTSMRPGYKLITDFKSKVHCWDEKYFFVMINSASVSDISRHYRQKWKKNMGRCLY